MRGIYLLDSMVLDPDTLEIVQQTSSNLQTYWPWAVGVGTILVSGLLIRLGVRSARKETETKERRTGAGNRRTGAGDRRDEVPVESQTSAYTREIKRRWNEYELHPTIEDALQDVDDCRVNAIATEVYAVQGGYSGKMADLDRKKLLPFYLDCNTYVDDDSYIGLALVIFKDSIRTGKPLEMLIGHIDVEKSHISLNIKVMKYEMDGRQYIIGDLDG
jgi:hypothetical protein